jgi:hypothetical protein
MMGELKKKKSYDELKKELEEELKKKEEKVDE